MIVRGTGKRLLVATITAALVVLLGSSNAYAWVTACVGTQGSTLYHYRMLFDRSAQVVPAAAELASTWRNLAAWSVGDWVPMVAVLPGGTRVVIAMITKSGATSTLHFRFADNHWVLDTN